MNKVAIALMVKDEARVIERCLASCLSLKPDLVVIVDTGSSDNTVVRAGMFLQENKNPYKIYFSKFVDFSTDRNELLEYVRKERDINYVIIMDADDIFHTDKDFDVNEFKDSLCEKVYQITFVSGNLTFYLPKLLSNSITANYKGVTHEYLDFPNNQLNFCEKFRIIKLNDGNRRVSNSKTKHDVELLEKGLKDTENEFLRSRYTFYLAQSYYDLGDYANAIVHYNNRAQMGGWNEEIFYSYYQLGNIFVKITPTNLEPILKFYLMAYGITKNRIEPLVALSKSLKDNDQSFIADTILQPIIDKLMGYPPTGLFVEKDKYVNPS